MVVVFRVDSSRRIGAGHVYRCLHLASLLQARGVTLRFVCRSHSHSLSDLIRSRGFRVLELPVRCPVEFANDSDYGNWLGASLEDEIRDLILVLSDLEEPVDWAIVDHYSLGAEWHAAVRPLVKRVMAIDDLANRFCDVDLFVDYSGADTVPSRYRNLLPRSCTRLLGPSFAILNPDFDDSDLEAEKRTGIVKRVLVSFGGYDPSGEVMKAATALLDFDVEVDFAVGQSSFGVGELRRLCSETSRFHIHVQSSDMVRLMLSSDLAIGAAGTSAWERCRAGLPSIVCVLADNQRRACFDLERLGAAWGVGFHAETDASSYAMPLQVLTTEPHTVKQMGQKARSLVDGLGAERVVAAMLAFD